MKPFIIKRYSSYDKPGIIEVIEVAYTAGSYAIDLTGTRINIGDCHNKHVELIWFDFTKINALNDFRMLCLPNEKRSLNQYYFGSMFNDAPFDEVMAKMAVALDEQEEMCDDKTCNLWYQEYNRETLKAGLADTRYGIRLETEHVKCTEYFSKMLKELSDIADEAEDIHLSRHQHTRRLKAGY